MFAKTCRIFGSVTAALTLLALGACGGGGGGSNGAPPVDGSEMCGVSAQKDWLRGYMLDQYLWSGASPNPEPADFGSLQSYFFEELHTAAQMIGGESRHEFVYIKSGVHPKLNISDKIADKKSQRLGGGCSRFSHMVATDADNIH